MEQWNDEPVRKKMEINAYKSFLARIDYLQPPSEHKNLT